jgi:hypothetical protein
VLGLSLCPQFTMVDLFIGLPVRFIPLSGRSLLPPVSPVKSLLFTDKEGLRSVVRRRVYPGGKRSAVNHNSGAGDGNRTHVTSLEGWSSTIELHPHAGWSFVPFLARRTSSLPAVIRPLPVR